MLVCTRNFMAVQDAFHTTLRTNCSKTELRRAAIIKSVSEED